MKNPINYVVCCLLVLFITSCSTLALDAGTKKLELGMTKQEVVGIFGNKYTSVGAAVTPKGNIETWRYGGYAAYDQALTIHYLDGKVVEWFQETIKAEPERTIKVKSETN